jgi:hypothetical protein
MNIDTVFGGENSSSISRSDERRRSTKTITKAIPTTKSYSDGDADR